MTHEVDRHMELRRRARPKDSTTAAAEAAANTPTTTLHPAAGHLLVESALAQDPAAAILDGTSDIFDQQLLDWTQETAASPTGGAGGFSLGGNLESDWLFTYPFQGPDRNARSGNDIENPSIRTSTSTASGVSTDPSTEAIQAVLHGTVAPSANPTDSLSGEGTTSTSTNPSSPRQYSGSSPSASADWLSSEMLETFETVEVCLAWGLHKSNNTNSKATSLLNPLFPTSLPNETLSCQKEALRTCEKWLSLDAHLIRARHVVLMVSIFRTILSSLDSMANALSSSPHDDWSPGAHDSSAFEAAEHDSPSRRPSRTSNNNLWDPHQDDGEGAHVLKSILNFRAAQVKRLLERLWTIAVSNQWQVQAYMVRQLLDRACRRRDLR
ncbi:hypothetical protein PG985_007729 [Apiospora marii]|uniref:uncharacterized protein n=1 Tax=Apiospora marii TaxID=335849 RepID=UPI0031327E56